MRRVAACETEEDADRVFHDILEEDYLNEKRLTPLSPQYAESLLRRNIGYMAGYYDHETAARIFRLFKTEHPIFGLEHPTTIEEGLWAGVRVAWENGGARHLSDDDIRKMMHHTRNIKKWRNP